MLITEKLVCGNMFFMVCIPHTITWRNIMWTKPAATEMRFGFEVTMYVMNK